MADAETARSGEGEIHFDGEPDVGSVGGGGGERFGLFRGWGFRIGVSEKTLGDEWVLIYDIALFVGPIERSQLGR